MHRTLIVIANASLARLFDRDPNNGGLVPVATLQHVESRLPGMSAMGGNRVDSAFP